VAKNRKTANHLTYAFRMKKITKHYWAITNGDFLNKNGIINIDIRGRNSEKLYSSLTYYHKYMKINNKLNWIIFRPITGRNHQIRIHSKSMGAPILGDKKYDNLFKESNNGLHLHSRSIEFSDLDGKKFFFEAPLPVHMVKTWEKYNLPIKSDFSGFKEFILES
jgi:23S rRNA pseudouridine955/2504/2580 synthase